MGAAVEPPPYSRGRAEKLARAGRAWLLPGHPRASPSFILIKTGPDPAGFPAAELGRARATIRLRASHFVTAQSPVPRLQRTLRLGQKPRNNGPASQRPVTQRMPRAEAVKHARINDGWRKPLSSHTAVGFGNTIARRSTRAPRLFLRA